MPNILTCSGNLSGAVSDIGDSVPHVLACDSDWQIIPYVEPTDSTAIYAQLVALNEFDPIQIAGLVTFCLVMFIVGFGVGMVINKLRRV
jgi:hypothetical protein